MQSAEGANPNLELSRAVWMSQEGGPLYDSWANEVIPATQQPAIRNRHVQLIEKINPGVTEGTVLDPHNIIRTLLRTDGGLLPDANTLIRASERLLLPRKKEILHFTSAATFIKDGLSEDEAISRHACDSLRFATAIGVGLVDDVFTVCTHKAKILLDKIMTDNVTNSSTDPSPALEAMKETLGTLWDTSLEQPGITDNPDALERFFRLQRLAFIAKSLRNRTLQDRLEEFSISAFDQLGDPSITLQSRPLRLSNDDPAQHRVEGWQYRAHHFGLLSTSNSSCPESVLNYDTASDVFSVPSKIIIHLHDALRRQNREGLRDKARKSAGNIQNLGLPLSVGCPVHNMGSIATAANLGADVFERVITYHQEHLIRAT